MKKNGKRNFWLSLITSLTLLLNTGIVFAAEGNFLDSAKLSGSKITVTGYASATGRKINIFLLNPGKTVSDLNSATAATFSDVVNYCNVVQSGLAKKYTDTFTIDNFNEDETYLLYVKDGNKSATREICAEKKIYVSKRGNDKTADGTSAKPFATIEGAKNYLRGKDRNYAVEVIIRGGDYTLSSGLNFDSLDSGSAEYPITYRAAEGEKVRIYGTTFVDAADFKKISDTAVLPRFQEGVRDKLIVLNLKDYGIDQSIVKFADKVDVGATGKPMGIYLNGAVQNIARWPDVGYETINVINEGGNISEKTQSAGGATLAINNMTDEIAARLSNCTDKMYVEGYMGYDWHSEWAKVESVDAASKNIKLSTYTYYGVKSDKRIAIVNAASELDRPGEWFVDSDNMMLYYYPPYTLTQKDKFEIATLKDNFINIDGAEYINFDGIEFAENAADPSVSHITNTAGNGIAILNGAKNINITNCKIHDIGTEAVVAVGSSNINIKGCEMYNVGFSAIRVNCGERSTLTSGNVVISDCIISDINRDTGNNAYGGIRLDGVGTIVENNIFHDIPNSAIRYAGNAHIIKHNEIYNTVNETIDAGAVYAGRSFSNYGTSVENNYFHDLGSTLVGECYVSAMFWDDMHSGNSFTGNIVDMNNTNRTIGVQINGGCDNNVDSNIFIDTMYGVYMQDGDNIPSTYDESDTSNFFNKTAFQSFKEAAENVSNAYYITDSDWYPAMWNTFPKMIENFKRLRDDKSYNRNSTIKNNVLYNNTSDAVFKGKRTSLYSLLNGTVKNNAEIKDAAVFVDVADRDYRVVASKKSANNITAEVPDSNTDITYWGLGEGYEPSEDLKKFTLSYPADGTNVAGSTAKLVWNNAPFADKYIYEVAKDSAFLNVVATGETAYNVAQVSGLEENTEYYWRVKGVSISRRFAGEFVSQNTNRFTTSGELNIKNISYDKLMNEITFTADNTSNASVTFTVAVAVKGTDGRLVDMRSLKKTIDAGKAQNMTISAYFKGAAAGGNLEFYAWDSLDNMIPILSEKVVFAR